MESSETTTQGNVEPTIYTREQHSISRRDIDPDALKIMYRLLNNNYKAYLVGGGVRDLLLGKQPKDFDIATDATPRRIKALFRNSRIIGRRFKLVHVFFGQGKIIEVSTFRDFTDPVEGDENDGNGAGPVAEEDLSPILRDNKYGDEATDAKRRDLTINALFYDVSRFAIVDYVGGMKDLRDEVVRVIGEPDVRYAEDPVRMIRVIRHAARASFSIEQQCWEAIARNRDLLLKASSMRIFEEIKKDLITGHFVETMRLMHEASLLELLLPELTANPSLFFAKNSLFSKMLGRVDEQARAGNPQPPTTSLALMVLALRDDGMGEKDLGGLFHDADDLRDHLKTCFSRLAVPRREREKIEQILLGWLHLAQTPIEKHNLGRLRVRECEEEFKALLELSDSTGEMLSDYLNLLNRPHSGSQQARRQPRGRRHRHNHAMAREQGTVRR